MKKENIENLLKTNKHLIYSISGRSMFPLLNKGDKVLLSKKDDYFLNDIVLFKESTKSNIYILHRVRKIIGNKYYILGDNSLRLDIIDKQQILAKLDGVYNGKNFENIDEGELSKKNAKSIKNARFDIDLLEKDKKKLLFDRFDLAVQETCKLLINPNSEFDVTKINCFTGEESDQYFSFLKNKKILHLVDIFYPKLDIFISENFRKEIEKNRAFVKLQYLRICELEKVLCKFFNEHKIKFMFVKGSENRHLYLTPYLRKSNDIDIYVSPKDFLVVKDLLVKEFNAKVLVSENPYHDSFIFKQYHLDVEVHHRLDYDLPKDLAYLLSNPFDNSIVDKENEYRYHMDIHKYYLYLVVHSAKHCANGELWISMLSDIFLINIKNQLNKEIINLARLTDYEKTLLNISKHLFEGQIVNDNERDFLKYLYIDNYFRYISLNKGKKTSKTRFIFSRIFVSRNYLIGLYPRLKDHYYLLPYYEIKRLFRIFGKNKAKNSLNEINKYSQSSNEVYNWLSNNGLNEYLTK